jgi:hypothetical protein
LFHESLEAWIANDMTPEKKEIVRGEEKEIN